MDYKINSLQTVDIFIEGICSSTKDPYSIPIIGKITKENKIIHEIPGFYYGENLWCVRFSEACSGTYQYEIVAPEISNATNLFGEIYVEDGNHFLPQQLHTQKNRFILQDGSDIFLMGYECDFLFSMFASPDGEMKTLLLIKKLKQAGFNKITLNAYAYDLDWNLGRTQSNDYGPPYIELWNITEAGRKFNPNFFQNLDRLISLLHENGIYVEMYYKVYNKMVPWPEKYSEEERQYIRMLTSRYQAFSNIIWNFTKEGYFEKDKDYIYDCLNMIRSLDSYHHLCTIHDDLEYALNSKYEKTIDFLTLQQQGEMSHACLYYSLRSGKPVVNGEFGNECGPNGILDTPAWKSYSPEDNARFAFQSVMAGAYITYYYSYAAWDIIEYEHNPKGFRYFRNLKEFFERYKFSRYHPAPELCAWSGLCLMSNSLNADGIMELLVYCEPKDERLYLLYWTGNVHLNPSFKKDIISVTKKGMFTNVESVIPPNDLIVSEEGCQKGSMVLECSPIEPCIFIIQYKPERN